MLSKEQIRSFYDRFGAKQDWQRFYEGAAVQDLVAHGDFDKAQAVFEIGCGTGWLAAKLLGQRLPKSATYLCFELSTTMVALSKKRLSEYGARARVHLTDGSLKLGLQDSQYDRFLSNYVFDLLAAEEIQFLLEEAHRILVPEGLLCAVSLTYGDTLPSQGIAWLWRRIFGIRPSLVGGCRPVRLLDFVSEKMWNVLHHNLVTAFGVPSEVIVARKPFE